MPANIMSYFRRRTWPDRNIFCPLWHAGTVQSGVSSSRHERYRHFMVLCRKLSGGLLIGALIVKIMLMIFMAGR